MIRRVLIAVVGLMTGVSAVFMTSAQLYQSVEQQVSVAEGEAANCDDRLASLALSLKLNPLNPEVLLQFGRTQQRCGFDSVPTFLRLTDNYPKWGLGWAHLFVVTMDQSGAEAAFSNAIANGGYEPDVQLLLLRAVVSRWNDLSIEMRRSVIPLAEMSLKSEAHHLKPERVALIRDSGLLRLVCLNSTLSACNDL